MKKIYSRTIAAAMVALLAFASCSKTEDTPPPPPAPVTPGVITLSVADITATSAVVTAKPANAQGTYYVSVVAKAQYDLLGSDSALIGKDMDDFKKLASDGGKTLVEYLTATLPEGEKLLTASLASPDTEYYAYAYGLGTDGKATTEVVKKVFTSTAIPVVGDAFTISVTGITSKEATLTIIPEDDKMLYFFELLAEWEYLKCGGTKEGIAEFVAEYIAEECGWSMQTPEEYIRLNGSRGVDGYSYSGLSASSTYYAFAVAVDASGVVAGEPTFEMFSTKEAQLSDLTFEVQIADITASSAHITITPSSLTETYLCDFQTVAACDATGSDSNLMSELVSMWGGSYGVQNKLKKGVFEYLPSRFDGNGSLKSDTEYYVLVFGYTDSPTTLLTKVKFKTAAEVVDPNVTFEFHVGVSGARTAQINVVPSNNNALYMWDVISAADFEKKNKDVKSCLQDRYDYWAGHGNTPGQVAIAMGIRGSEQRELVGMNPNTGYYVWAICVKADGTMVGNGAYSDMFTTMEAPVSQATIQIRFSKFYSGDELHAADPEAYTAVVKGKAFVPVRIIPSPASVRWYSAVAEGDFVDTEKLSQRGVIDNVKISNENRTDFVFLVPFNKQVTFLGYALDKDNEVGLAARVRGNFAPFAVSPISDLIGPQATKANRPYANMMVSKSIVDLMDGEKYTGMKSEMSVASKDAPVVNSVEPMEHMELGAKALVTSKKAVAGYRKSQRR